MSKNYIKIETPFLREDSGSRRILEGEFRSAALQYLQPLPFEWTEKIDGVNIVVRWDGSSVSFEGHSAKVQIPDKLQTYLENHFGGSDAEELFEQSFGESTVELYGEGFGAGIQSGGSYSPDQSFIMFDVYFPEQNLWLLRKDVDDVARTFGVPSVPVLFTGTLNEAISFVRQQPKSTIGSAKMEGVVGRPPVELFDRRGNRVIVKVKCCDFPPIKEN